MHQVFATFLLVYGELYIIFFMEDNDIVIQAVVIIIDGLVYPSIFPNYVAFQYRDDELKRMELLKAELETYEPDEPF